MMRVDHVSVAITGYLEFEGTRILRFDFVPEPGDPLVAALLEKNDALLLAQAKANPIG